MKNRSLIFAALFGVLCLSACDEGDIREANVGYAQGGYTVKLHGRLTGLAQWDDGQGVVLAAFDDKDRDYDMGEMQIPAACEGKDTTLVWTHINSTATTVELCVATRLRRRVATFQRAAFDQHGDTLVLEVGDLYVGRFGAVEALFAHDRKCVGCHGEGNLGQLQLDKEHAYANLVNQPSRRAEFDGAMRVVPGNAEASALHLMLDPASEKGQGVTMFNHKAAYGDAINQQFALSVIDQWINAGAMR